MRTLIDIIEAAGGFNSLDHLRIDNPPYMSLVIERLAEPGPDGNPAISIAHYGELNGDAMRDPEICAEVVAENGKFVLWPYYFRNDYVGVEQWSRQRDEDNNAICLARRTRELVQFLRLWDQNLRDQGFLKAFERSRRTPWTTA